MLVSRVVFVVESTPTARDHERFGIELLRGEGFRVEVWDLTPVLHPVYHASVDIPDPAPADPGYRTFMRRDGARAALVGLSRSDFAVMYVGVRPDTLSLFRAVRRTRYAVHVVNAVPRPSLPRRLAGPAEPPLARLRASAAHRLADRLPGVPRASLLLAGGARSLDARPAVARGAEILWLHAFDYDTYLSERLQPPPPCAGTAVFLDEDFPFHSDFVHMGVRPPVSAADYYPVMNRWFDAIETTTGLRVVIAAHPRSTGAGSARYGGREVVRGATARLVRGSERVLAHSSTSVNLAVLFGKPLTFLTLGALHGTRSGASIHAAAAAFGQHPIDVSLEQVIPEASVDPDIYARYRHDYIKRDDTPDDRSWSQFARRLRHYA